MEIPNEYKDLYKHWKYHTSNPFGSTKIVLNEDHLPDIFSFISERTRIWEKKYANCKPPFTEDGILKSFRFCNIYRELDRQTIDIHRMLKPYENDFDLWLLNLSYIRFVCNPQTVKKTRFLNFNQKNNQRVMEKLKSLPTPKYGNAYVFPISVIQHSPFPTREEFFCKYLPLKISDVSLKIRKFDNIGVKDALEIVLPEFGFNFKFHWTEILIDIAYQFPEYIDLFKKFPIGPGSLPTMKLLSNADPEDTCLSLCNLVVKEFPYLTLNGEKILLSAENWEGIGCEFRKYSNLKNGFGRVRKFI